MSDNNTSQDNSSCATLEAPVQTTKRYTAIICSTNEGYSFANTVREGYSTTETNGDIFVPGTFEVGSTITFDLLDVNPRKENQFRASDPVAVTESMILLDGQKLPVHMHPFDVTDYNYRITDIKSISHEDVAKALGNKPLATTLMEVMGFNAMEKNNNRDPDVHSPCTQNVLESAYFRQIEDFLSQTFTCLEQVGDFSFSIIDIDENTEVAQIKEVCASYAEIDMNDMIQSIELEYERLKVVRNIFIQLQQKGISRLSTGYLAPLFKEVVNQVTSISNNNNLSSQLNATTDKLALTQKVCEACEILSEYKIFSIQELYGKQLFPDLLQALVSASSLNDQAKRDEQFAFIIEQIRSACKACHFMKEHSVLKSEAIISNYQLPDVLTIAPVWYTWSKDAFEDRSHIEDPRPDAITRYFCNVVDSQEFANLYQLYNRRTRSVNTFQGRDLMTADIAKLFKQAKEVFDIIIIATPYHDQASKEWADPEWQRNIDPYLIGFLKNEPSHMYLLARWSQTGLFPHVGEMIADTMNHLTLKHREINRFFKNPYWYNVINKKDIDHSTSSTQLSQFARNTVFCYQQGKLYEFLRGEIPADELKKMQEE